VEPDWLALAPGPLVLFVDDEVVEATPTACAELHRTRDELLGTGLLDALRDEDAALLRAVLAEMRAGTATGDLGDDVFRVVRTRSGTYADFVEMRMRRIDDRRVAAVVIDASQEHRLDAIVGHLASSTFIVDERGDLIWRPLGNARRLGIADEAALGAFTLEWIHPEELPEVLRLFNDLLNAPGERRSAIIRSRQPYVDQGWTVTRLTGVNALDDPAVRGIIVRSEEQEGVAQLASVGHTGGRFQSLAEAAPIGILVTERDGRVVFRNELARDLLGDEGAESWIDQARATHRDDLVEATRRALAGEQRGTVLAPFDRREGTRWLEVTVVPQTDEDGRPFGLIATLQDVTAETEARQELRAAQDRLWHMANHDQLTGVPNRSLLVDRLDQALAREQRDHHGVAILYGDLDGFKDINDRHGHAAGDDVLIEVARRLVHTVRNTDTVCRFGGDEFLVLLERFDDPSEVVEIAERVLEIVARPLTSVRGAQIGITLGLAIAEPDMTAGALLAAADNAMYRAKAHGKGRWERYA
jgi:diguanylate cyclase (GGDEF)-like protein/PAS domain S-box-containing protein